MASLGGSNVGSAIEQELDDVGVVSCSWNSCGSLENVFGSKLSS